MNSYYKIKCEIKVKFTKKSLYLKQDAIISTKKMTITVKELLCIYIKPTAITNCTWTLLASFVKVKIQEKICLHLTNYLSCTKLSTMP
jgi:hypothetical protein